MTRRPWLENHEREQHGAHWRRCRARRSPRWPRPWRSPAPWRRIRYRPTEYAPPLSSMTRRPWLENHERAGAHCRRCRGRSPRWPRHWRSPAPWRRIRYRLTEYAPPLSSITRRPWLENHEREQQGHTVVDVADGLSAGLAIGVPPLRGEEYVIGPRSTRRRCPPSRAAPGWRTTRGNNRGTLS